MGANVFENLQTIDAVFSWTIIIAGLLWALYARHIREAESPDPPPPDGYV